MDISGFLDDENLGMYGDSSGLKQIGNLRYIAGICTSIDGTDISHVRTLPLFIPFTKASSFRCFITRLLC